MKENKDTLWGFRVGDIITDKNPLSEWYQKRVIVVRIGRVGGSGPDVLSGQPEGGDFNSRRYADGPEGLVFLERPKE